MSLPYNEELEKRLLSVLMFGPGEVQSAVTAGMTADAFYLPMHHAIFKALCLCAASGGGTDSIAVWKAMSGLSSKPQDSQTALYVSTLEGLEPTTARRNQLIADVLALQRQRAVIKALDGARQEAIKSASSWTDCWERVEPHISAVQGAAEGFGERPIQTMVDEAKKMLIDPGMGGFTGPFSSWDHQSKILRRGQLALLAGRPGTGKTALALQYLYSALRSGRHGVIFSLEMLGGELFERMGKQISRSVDKLEAVNALDTIPLNKLHIYEARDHATMAQIEARCKLLASAHEIGIVIVDYLQLVTPSHDDKKANREVQVASMSRRFKLLAGLLPCPLMVLCQLNRQSEIQERRPRLSDLRESGALEQDADAVWFLYQNTGDVPLDNESENTTIDIIQAKRRNGRANICAKLNFHHPTLLFTPIINR